MTQAEAESEFRDFLVRAAQQSPFRAFQRLPEVSPEQAKEKALEVLQLFSSFEAKLRFPDARTIEEDFDDFYRKILLLLPPDDEKVDFIRRQELSGEDIARLYIKVTHYLASFRVLAIYTSFRRFESAPGPSGRERFHYSFHECLYFIDEVSHLGVPVVTPLLGTGDSSEAVHGRAPNGIPFIVGTSIEGYGALIHRFGQLVDPRLSGSASLGEAYGVGGHVTDRTAGAISVLEFEGLPSAIAFSMAKLLKMKETEAEIASALKLATAWHEKQHADDFINPAEQITQRALSSAGKERRGELRARIVALRHAPWGSLFGILASVKARGEAVYQQVMNEIYRSAMRVVQDNRVLFARLLTPLEEEAKSRLGIADNSEVHITAELYKLALPEFDEELKVLTLKIGEVFRVADLFVDKDLRRVAGRTQGRRTVGLLSGQRPVC